MQVKTKQNWLLAFILEMLFSGVGFLLAYNCLTWFYGLSLPALTIVQALTIGCGLLWFYTIMAEIIERTTTKVLIDEKEVLD